MTSKHENIEQALEECLERIRQGASLEDALRRHPEQAAELRPLLQIALALERADFLAPSEATKARLRTRFEGAARLRADEMRRPKTGWLNGGLRLWTTSLASVAAFVVLGSVTLWASSGSLPDQPLYGVKRAVERVQVAMASSPQEQATAYLDLADRRVDEVARLAESGDAAGLAKLAPDVAQQVQFARASVGGAVSLKDASSPATSRSVSPEVPEYGRGGAAPAPEPTPSTQGQAPAFGVAVAPSASPSPSPETKEGAPPTALNGRNDQDPVVTTAQDKMAITVTPADPGWNLVSLPELNASVLDALPAEQRAFVLQVQDRATRNLALLYYLKMRSPENVRAALQEVINASAESYAAVLQAYMGPAGAQWDVRRQMLQIDAVLERRGSGWRIAGRDISITSETRVVHALEAGKAFRVSGAVLPNGEYLALFIEHGASGDNGRENEVHVSGIWQYDKATGDFSVGGFMLLPLSRTVMEGQPQVGGWVRVVGALLPEGLAPAQITAVEGP